MSNVWVEQAGSFGQRRGISQFPPLKLVRDWWDARLRAVSMRRARKLFVSLDGTDTFRQMAFTFAIIALSAKLARVDGAPKREEFVTFREVFPMPESERDKIRSLYAMAAKDDADALHHARQIAGLFSGAKFRNFRLEVLRGLLRIALADGSLTEGEAMFLRRVAGALGISRWQFSRLLRTQGHDARDADPYFILGADASFSDGEIKQIYYRKVREHHPDSVMARGGDADALDIAARRVAAINNAYNAIRETRGCYA